MKYQIPDELQSYFGSDANKYDTDNDGLSDYEECIILAKICSERTIQSN